jgi:hypothetical protein
MSHARRLLATTLLASTLVLAVAVAVAVAHAAIQPGRSAHAKHPYSIAPRVAITGVTADPLLRIVEVYFRPAVSSPVAKAYQCSIKLTGTKPRYSRCSSPSVYTHVTPGLYTVKVRAVAGGVHYPAATNSVGVPIQFSNCWGAASRDPQHRCYNPALSGTVVPTPDDALLEPVAYCRDAINPSPGQQQCTFGFDPSPGRVRVALIGDSHGAAMGRAMNYTAEAEGWSGVALIHNGCGFSTALQAYRTAGVAQSCYDWGQSVVQYLTAHPGLRDVFITGNDEWQYRGSPEVGFEKIWHELPASVRNIYIIRDVPRGLVNEPDCVDNAIAHHRKAIGPRCSVPRSAVLPFDAEAQAAKVSSSSRVHLFDFTSFFCGSRCFPVIGGVLVLTDEQHMTPDFSATLGPYIVRAVKQR